MTDEISQTQLQQYAEAATAAHAHLVAAVRRADANGIPHTVIARAIGRNRETVRRWCTDA